MLNHKLAAGASKSAQKRLVIMLHGSHGHASDFTDFSAALRSRLAGKGDREDEHLQIAQLACCEGWATDGGVDAVISAVTAPLRTALRHFDDVCRDAECYGSVYVVGHSLGGVVLRGALGRLDATDTLLSPRYSLDTYMSVASPHLGIGHTSRAFQTCARWAAHLLGSRTYRDLLLDTHCLDSLAADPHVDRALSTFRRRVLISAAHDHLVPPCSSLICPVSEENFSALPKTEEDVVKQIELPTFLEAEASDIYSPLVKTPLEKAAWDRAAPALGEQKLRRVVAMTRMMRGKGREDRFDSFVALFPARDRLIAHRAVLGIPPWNGKRLRKAYVTRLAELLL